MHRLASRLMVGLIALALSCAVAFAQNNFPTPGGSRVDGGVVMCLDGSNNAVPCSIASPLPVNATVSATITFPTFGAAFPATGTANGMSQGGNLTAMTGTAGNLNVNCQVGCSGGSFNNNADGVATSATNGQVAAWLYGWNGTTWDRMKGDTTNGLFVNVKTSVLPTGAATAANQATEIASLATIATNTGAAIPAGTALIGKVGIDQTTDGTTNAVHLVAGTAIAGKFGIDQTTPGTTNLVTLAANQSVNVAQINGVTPLMGAGATGTGSPRVTISDNNGAYETVAASQTAQAMGATGATGDYLSHCVIYPASTTPGVVTVFDNTSAAGANVIAFPGGASSVSSLAPIAIPVGAVSTAGAWKVTTGANVIVTCYGRFT